MKKRDKQIDKYCQDCQHYKKPYCKMKEDFTARKRSCEKFMLRFK